MEMAARARQVTRADMQSLFCRFIRKRNASVAVDVNLLVTAWIVTAE
jgi:hypothetical protein